MTTIINIDKECVICKHSYEDREMASAFIVSRDLDGRSSILSYGGDYIKTCPACNYCSPDISRVNPPGLIDVMTIDKAVEEIKKIIESDSYKEQLNSNDYSKSINICLCYGMISERLNYYSDAARAFIYAAWNCDSQSNRGGAVKFRKKALHFMDEAKKKSQIFARSEIDEYLIKVDLLRRAEEFEEALKVCNEGLEKFSKTEEPGNELNLKVLNFQKELVTENDGNRYKTDDIGKRVKTCALCGKETMQYPAVENMLPLFRPLNEKKLSALERDKFYLDGRGEDKYYKKLIQVCHCGYSGPDIGKKTEEIEKIVNSKPYKEEWENPVFQYGREFLCYSHILESQEDYREAGWACVYAAWICDDGKEEKMGIKPRIRAVEIFKKAREKKQSFASSPEDEDLILIDLFRRARNFPEALGICNNYPEYKRGNITPEIVDFQESLIIKEDSSHHTIKEAFDFVKKEKESEETKKKVKPDGFSLYQFIRKLIGN